MNLHRNAVPLTAADKVYDEFVNDDLIRYDQLGRAMIEIHAAHMDHKIRDVAYLNLRNERRAVLKRIEAAIIDDVTKRKQVTKAPDPEDAEVETKLEA